MEQTSSETIAPLEVLPSNVGQHAARKHDKISPSKLNNSDPMVGGCYGFQSREGTNDAAEQGTRLHEVMERELNFVLELAPLHDETTFPGYLFGRRIAEKWNDEEYSLILWAAQQVGPYLKGLPRQAIVQESRRTVTGIDGKQLMYGHDDLMIRRNPTMAIVVDYKFGIDPVLPAQDNRQGWAYAIAVLQGDPNLEKVGVMFVQPKLRATTKAVFSRSELTQKLIHIHRIVDNAKIVQADDHPGLRSPGSACDWCALRGPACRAYMQHFQLTVQKFHNLPVLPSINLDAITTPEQAVAAQVWIKFLDDEALSAIKQRCLDIIKAAGGSATLKLDDGQEITYKVVEKQFPRTIGSPPAVAEALALYVEPTAVLSAAKLSLEKLVDVVVPAIQQEQEVSTGEKCTKEEATTMLEGILLAHGLIHREEGKTEYLKQQKTAKKERKPKKVAASAA